MMGLLGSRDSLLRLLEENLAADIHVRGNRVTLRGSAQDVAFAERTLRELLALQESGSMITPDAVRRTIGMLADPGAGSGRHAVAGARAEHHLPARTDHPAQDAEPEAVRRRHRRAHHRLRHRPGRYRQDLPGDGQGRSVAAGQAGHPDHPHPASGRGGGATRFPARHAVGQDRPVPAPAVRRAARHARSGVDPAADGRRHHRGRSAGLHARPHAERRLHHSRRGAEHHARADEDVPHPARLRVQDRGHRRRHPGRPARRSAIGPAGGPGDPR